MKSTLPAEKKPHILILSQYYAPDVTAAAFRIRETADLMTGKGYSVTVITAVPHRGDAGSDAGSNAGSNAGISGGAVTVLRVPIIPYTGKGKLNYIVHYTSFMLNAIMASIKIKSRPDAVYATSPPLFTALAGLVIALLKGVPFTLDVRDLWPESAVSAGQISGKSIFFKVGKLMERYIYKASRFITCVSKPMASAINEVAPSASVTVIYNGILQAYCEGSSGDTDSERIVDGISGNTSNESSEGAVNGSMGSSVKGSSESAVTEASEETSLETSPVTVLYTGNFGHCQAMDLCLDAARMLKTSEEKGIKLRFVGDGVLRKKMEKYVADHGLDNVTITGPVSKEEAFSEMRKSSALLLALIDDETMEKTIPSKVFDYMAAGKPVVYGIKGEGREILGAVGGNLHFDSSSPQSLVEALKALKAELEELSLKARDNAVQVKSHFTRERMVDRLDECFQKLFRK